MNPALIAVAERHVHDAYVSGAGSAALVGLFGVLAGALIALAGTLIVTSKQIDRQERDARRAVYADFLAKALAVSNVATDQRRAHLTSRANIDLYNHLAEEAEQDYNRKSVEYIKSQAHQARSRALSCMVEEERLADDYRDKHHAFLSRAHELKILSPEPVHDAATLVYEAIGERMRINMPEHDDTSSHEAEALQIFSKLARADSRSPDAIRLRRAVREVRPSMARLEAEIARVADQIMSAEEPFELPLRPLDINL